MRIFLTGGTGSIGSAVVKALVADGHQVTTLARSEASAMRHKDLGAHPVRGSLTEPEQWVTEALEHDAFVHAAATFEGDMGDVDLSLVNALTKATQALPVERRIPFIYTGGCWLYPEASVIPITERHVMEPIPEFAWMLDSIEALHACSHFLLTVIHPAQVVDKGRGLIATYAEELKTKGSITIVGSTDTQFPFVHADDLADLYRRAITHKGDGLLLNASGIKSATALEVAQLVAQKLELPYQANVISVAQAQQEMGNWASGYARSQRMVADRAIDQLGWAPAFTSIEALVDDSLSQL